MNQVHKGAEIAIIGGSGLYDLEGLTIETSLPIETPFGMPSGEVVIGDLDEVRVAFLARHGKGHRFNPTNVPYRANIYALKSLGVKRILSVSAVGSLKLEILPCDFVVPDQIIDRTRLRPSTFFDTVAVHIPFADPFCPQLSQAYVDAAKALGVTIHAGGTYVCMEGPAFSTKAESKLYRSWGASVIGMTCIPESKLAREAEICYATLAAATDYDVWHEEPVTAEMVLNNFKHNVQNIKRILREVIRKVPESRECNCGEALKGTMISDRNEMTEANKERYRLLLGERG